VAKVHHYLRARTLGLGGDAMQGLGELEEAVMGVLWQAQSPLTVRDVLSEINRSRALAYTTVMTVLDNLHRKGWAQRERSGRAYRYRPTEAREEAAARTLRDLLTSTGDPDGVLLHFVRSASDHESTILRRALGERKN
jgi:predicted transcriptional regulator